MQSPFSVELRYLTIFCTFLWSMSCYDNSIRTRAGLPELGCLLLPVIQSQRSLYPNGGSIGLLADRPKPCLRPFRERFEKHRSPQFIVTMRAIHKPSRVMQCGLIKYGLPNHFNILRGKSTVGAIFEKDFVMQD